MNVDISFEMTVDISFEMFLIVELTFEMLYLRCYT